MKKRDLIRHLREHGCVFERDGARHELWANPANNKTSAVPRHRELNTHTCVSICNDLQIPPPPVK